MADLGDGRIMIIGGIPTHREVIIYHQAKKSFTQGPSLRFDRYTLACPIFRSPLHNGRPVIMVVGSKPNIEILDFTIPGSVWEERKYCTVL